MISQIDRYTNNLICTPVFFSFTESIHVIRKHSLNPPPLPSSPYKPYPPFEMSETTFLEITKQTYFSILSPLHTTLTFVCI